MEQVEDSIERYIAALETADRQDGELAPANSVRLKDKIAALKAQMQAFNSRLECETVGPAVASYDQCLSPCDLQIAEEASPGGIHCMKRVKPPSSRVLDSHICAIERARKIPSSRRLLSRAIRVFPGQRELQLFEQDCSFRKYFRLLVYLV
jgi:hypothetical protein